MSTSSTPADPAIQLLTPQGERVEHTEYGEYLADFSDDEYRGLYRDMVLVRRADAEATALQRQGELGLWASLLGQEAAQIGAGRALGPQDVAFPTYREHGVLWCRGMDLFAVLSLFRGANHGAWSIDDHGLAPYTIVIGAQTLHATGYAMGVQKDGTRGEDAAVMTFFGDGATSEGDVNEAFIWASVYDAPVVFFCQNNQYAISEPTQRQTHVPLYQRARGFGFPGLRVDGNDVLASYAVARAALDRAHHGQGPTFIEAFTYRMGAHTTSDDPTRYRINAEVEQWRSKDPIARYRIFLTNEQLAEESYFAAVDEEANALAADLRARCLALPDPGPLQIFDEVYAQPTPELIQQRDEYAEYLAGFEGMQSSSGMSSEVRS